MATFIVPVKTVLTETFRVKAKTAEEAMYLAIENGDSDFVLLIEEHDGDPEVYFPGIREEKECLSKRQHCRSSAPH